MHPWQISNNFEGFTNIPHREHDMQEAMKIYGKIEDRYQNDAIKYVSDEVLKFGTYSVSRDSAGTYILVVTPSFKEGAKLSRYKVSFEGNVYNRLFAYAAYMLSAYTDQDLINMGVDRK